MATLFFIASKLVWAVIRPETILLLLATAGLTALLRGRRRIGTIGLFTALAAFAVIGVFPIGSLLIRPLETSYSADPDVGSVSGIIVLGGGEDADRSAYWGVPLTNDAGDRFLSALALAHRYPQAKVLFTGGRGSLDQSGPSGASTAHKILLSAGLAPSRLLLEDRSRNTAENATFSKALLGGAPTGTWLLVTSAWHMPRAMETFCADGWQHLVPWPTDFRSGPFWREVGWDLPNHLTTLDAAIHEWVGLLAYRLTGRARSGNCHA